MPTRSPHNRLVALFTDYPARVTVYRLGFLTALFAFVTIDTAVAQSVGTSFCGTELAQTIKNIFSIIQFGGPLIGGVVALGATVVTPAVRRADYKQELKEMRNQAIVWGVIVAPLATVILQFILNNVVVGGSSCGF